MNQKELKKLLEEVKDGKTDINDAMKQLRDYPYKDLGYAKIDNQREIRTGYPEIIYCAGKTVDQVKGIAEYMNSRNTNIIATRATMEMYQAIGTIIPEAIYHKEARIISITKKKLSIPETYISVITAGTSDLPVAEEAAVTAELLGNKVERVYDAGVAGIHRLVSNIQIIRNSRVVIVIAGMEGALASIIGGLINKPIIAVPTSIGYGANFGGVSALLAMLTSCAAGVSVVNIDNGFGAGYNASLINKI
ncbi:MAG: nickel pincer cofactor biosynthesis protein LarB [Bacteroidales bacterium]|nr:MAG: nickel pincer cofactor biosynthesis protein LarB [Bacteroidales bacterium]